MYTCALAEKYYKDLYKITNNSDLPLSTAFFVLKSFTNEVYLEYYKTLLLEESQQKEDISQSESLTIELPPPELYDMQEELKENG